MNQLGIHVFNTHTTFYLLGLTASWLSYNVMYVPMAHCIIILQLKYFTSHVQVYIIVVSVVHSEHIIIHIIKLFHVSVCSKIENITY